MLTLMHSERSMITSSTDERTSSGNMHDIPYYIITFSALYVSGNGSFLALGILIGEKCVYLTIRQRSLVNGHLGTYVLRKDVLFFCMARILPLTESREMILVKPFKLITVYVEEIL